jgi:hypothetical protein
VFYPRRAWEIIGTQFRFVACFVRIHRLRHRIEHDPTPYTDRALTMPEDASVAFSLGEKAPAAAA